jgi:hypothetical protein
LRLSFNLRAVFGDISSISAACFNVTALGTGRRANTSSAAAMATRRISISVKFETLTYCVLSGLVKAATSGGPCVGKSVVGSPRRLILAKRGK